MSPEITRDWAATTFVVHEGRTLLLHHRKLDKWLPPGGHIDPHELPDVAALREVEEETGLKAALLDAGEPLGEIRRLAQPLCILLESIAPGHEHIDLIYVARVIQGDVTHAPDEAHAWRWYTAAELESPEVPLDVSELGKQAIALVDEWERARMSWADLAALLDAAPGDYSLCVWRDGAQVFGYREHVTRSAASLIKVPLAMAIIDSGIDLDATVSLYESDRVEGDGTFDHAPAGVIATLRELIAYALTQSDNTASNLLIDRIGFDRVNAWLAEHRLTTRLRRKFMDGESWRAGRDNTTTAADMCAIFDRLRDGRYESLIELLSHSVGDGKLEAGLPPGVRIAHKVGDLPGVEHDAGIVYAPGAPYVIAVLAVDLLDVDSGRRTIADASRLAWRMMTG